MLRLDLSEIIRTSGMRQTFEINEPPYKDEDVEYSAPLKGRLVITNTGSVLLIRGPFHTAITQECSRCLTPVNIPIDVELEEEFDLKVIEDAVHHDKVVEVVEDEIGRVFDGKVLQLNVLFRQAALLAAPLQPLCREDCPGIAMQSSADDAEVETEDERLINSPFRELSHYFEE